MGVEITAPNSTLHYENLPELPPGFLHPHPFPNTPIIKDKRILIFCGKNNIIYPFKHTEVFKREIQPHEMVKYLSERVAVL